MNPLVIKGGYELLKKILPQVLGSDRNAQKLQQEIESKYLDRSMAGMDFAKDWLKADSTGAWYQKAWRPALMFTFIMIILLYGFIAPLLQATLGIIVPPPNFKDIPTEIWNIIGTSVGVIGGGRSLEKIAKIIKKKPEVKEAIVEDLEVTPYKEKILRD